MEWRIRIHRKALKFLHELDPAEKSRVEDKLAELLSHIEKGLIPYKRLDIKRLKGKWHGFLRMRVGKLRIIFKINIERKEILVYSIHYRKTIEKNSCAY